ncbi:unnamed protein product [Prorocentrum cordatum]|uniref:Uncharacterized protein n=1 Tax=Prorocentrum cordatum TaxID=2364126 RepID=A0ABN9RYK9_9DINO|nr:unnamed protein product [Polarella glacialis]
MGAVEKNAQRVLRNALAGNDAQGEPPSSAMSCASACTAFTAAPSTAPSIGGGRGGKRGINTLEGVTERQQKTARLARTVCIAVGCQKKLSTCDKRAGRFMCEPHWQTYTIGYNYMADDEIGEKTENDETFRKAFDSAHSHRVTMDATVAEFGNADIDTHFRNKARCERRVGFWSRSDLHGLTGCMPEQLGAKCQKLWGEHDNPLQGVLVDEFEDAPRTFVISCGKSVLRRGSAASVVSNGSQLPLSSPGSPKGGAGGRLASPGCVPGGEGIVDVREPMQSDPVKAKWTLQLHKVSHSLALTGKKSLGRHMRRTYAQEAYAQEADTLGRSEGDGMREHASLNEAAEQIATQNGWCSMARTDLDALLQKLVDAGVDFPTKFKNDCIARALQDWSQSTASLEERVTSLLDMVQAWPSTADDGAFEPLQPRLRHVEGSPKDRMATMADIVLKKAICPLIKDGARNASVTMRVMTTIITAICAASDDDQLDFEPCEDGADELCSLLRGIVMVTEPDLQEQQKVGAANIDFDKLQDVSASVPPGETNVIATLAQNGHYKHLLAEFVRCRPHLDEPIPRLIDSEKRVISVDPEGPFQDNCDILLNAWKVKRSAKGKVRPSQSKKLTELLEASTLSVIGAVLSSIEAGTFPDESCGHLKDIAATCSEGKLAIPGADAIQAHLLKVAQKQTVVGHLHICCNAHDSLCHDAPLEARKAAAVALVSHARTYADFGIAEKSEDLELKIALDVTMVMDCVGAGEDVHMIEDVCNYIMIQCQLCAQLFEFVKEPTTDLAKAKACLEALSGLQWDFASIYTYTGLGADFDERMAADARGVAMGRLAAGKLALVGAPGGHDEGLRRMIYLGELTAFAALPGWALERSDRENLEAQAVIGKDFFYRWATEAVQLASAVMEADCAAKAAKLRPVVFKLDRAAIYGCAALLWHEGLAADAALENLQGRAKTTLFANARPAALKGELDALRGKLHTIDDAMTLHGDENADRLTIVGDAQELVDRMMLTHCEALCLVLFRDFGGSPLKLKRNLEAQMAMLPEKLHQKLPAAPLANIRDKVGIKK